MTVMAYLLRDAAGQKSPWPLPVLSFRIQTWAGLPADGIAGARLIIYECDYADEAAATGAAPRHKDEVARLLLDVTGPDPANAAAGVAIARATVEQAHWRGKLRAPGKTKESLPPDKARVKGSDFALYLGGEGKAARFVPLTIPRAAGPNHDEGRAFELGMQLEVGGKVVAEQLTDQATAVATVPIADSVSKMLGLYTRPVGAAASDSRVTTAAAKAPPEGKKKAPPVLLGRFNDPTRRPDVEPGVAKDELEVKVLALLGSKTDKHVVSGDDVVDVDGLRLSQFVTPDGREAMIATLRAAMSFSWGKSGEAINKEFKNKKPEDKAAALAERDARRKTIPEELFLDTDIEAAYFVVHDVGSYGLTDTRWTIENVAEAGKGVHGFLNHGGLYAPQKDFSATALGTVYQFHLGPGGDWLAKRCINIETTPIDTTTPPSATDASKYAFVGQHEVSGVSTFFLWTHAAIDALADLYLLASARAGHLLTVTCHSEIDRSLIYSSIFPRGAAAVAALAKNATWRAKLLAPYNMHGDPYGFDLQVFYDKITARLNALSARRKLPRGVRYGCHPDRVLSRAKLEKGYPTTVGNMSGHLHTFPHQSNPDVLRMKQSISQWKGAWWEAAPAKP